MLPGIKITTLLGSPPRDNTAVTHVLLHQQGTAWSSGPPAKGWPSSIPGLQFTSGSRMKTSQLWSSVLVPSDGRRQLRPELGRCCYVSHRAGGGHGRIQEGTGPMCSASFSSPPPHFHRGLPAAALRAPSFAAQGDSSHGFSSLNIQMKKTTQGPCL